MALEHIRGVDRREIIAARHQRGLRGADPHNQCRRQQRGELGQRNRSKTSAFGDDRLGAEPGRLSTQRGCWIRQIANYRRRHFGGYRNRQRTREVAAWRQPERYRAPTRQNHPRRSGRDAAQPPQLPFGYEFGGQRQHIQHFVADQYRLAAPQRGDSRAQIIYTRARPCRRLRIAHRGRNRSELGHPHLLAAVGASYGATGVAPANYLRIGAGTKTGRWTSAGRLNSRSRHNRNDASRCDDVLLFGSDYPHCQSCFPHSIDKILDWRAWAPTSGASCLGKRQPLLQTGLSFNSSEITEVSGRD